MSSEETEKSENEWKKQFYNRIYLSEVISECRYALLSMAYLRFAISTRNNDLILVILSVALSYAYSVCILSGLPAVPRNDICTRIPVVIDAACATATADLTAFRILLPYMDPDASMLM